MTQKITDQLKGQVLETVKTVFPEVEIALEDISLEHPQAPEHGDYSTNIALKLAEQLSGQRKNFLENIDWIVKTIDKDNFEDFQEPLPVGRLSPVVQEAIGAKTDRVCLKPRIYAKMMGWWSDHPGHKELRNLFWYLPLICFAPIAVYKDPHRGNGYLLTFEAEHFGVLVLEILEKPDRNEIVTVFYARKRRIEKSSLGKRRISSLLALRRDVGVAGAGLSSLRESQRFYSTLDPESQEQVLWYEEKLAPREIAERTIATMTASDKINETKDKRYGTKDKIKDGGYEIKDETKDKRYEIKGRIKDKGHGVTGVEKIEAAGGFINFTLAKEWLVGEAGRAVEKGEKYGTGECCKDKKIMVEFAHPNTHKAFHIGHLRNITLGESLVRLLEFSGAKVIRANYQGDVGLHVAKALWGVKKLREEYERVKTQSVKEKAEFLGRAYALGSQTFEANEEVKAEIGELNRAIYRKDSKIMPLWQETRQWSLDYFDLIYQRVYTTFDRLYFEGEVAERGKELVLQNVGKIFKESDGAIIFPGDKFKLHNRVFINSEGNPTYEAKDMGLGELQFKEYSPDLLIHNLGPEQSGYMQVMFAALAQIFPKTRGREMHLPYGWVKLKEGKMSSRAGNVVLGEWLLDEIKRRIAEKYPNRVADPEPIAVAAAKYSLLKVGRMQEVAFDIDESISLEGDSGPYLQYTYARARSVLRKAEEQDQIKDNGYGIMDRKTEKGKGVEELAILRWLYRFPEVVEAAAKTYSPNLICSYLFALAQRFNNFYNNVPILPKSVIARNEETKQSDKKIATPSADAGARNDTGFRLALTGAVAQVLKNGLTILGIAALERM